MKKKLFSVLVLFLWFTFPVFAEQNKQIAQILQDKGYKTAAVLHFLNIDGKKSALGNYFAEQIINYLNQKAGIKVVERALIEQIMQEQLFNLSGNVVDSAAGIGKIAGADVLISGTLTKVGRSVVVNMKIVATEAAMILFTGKTEIQGPQYLSMYNHLLE
jgi:TolB-like protein